MTRRTMWWAVGIASLATVGSLYDFIFGHGSLMTVAFAACCLALVILSLRSTTAQKD